VSIPIISEALGTINRALGISGGRGQTQFEDETLTQVLDVSSSITRGRAPVGTGGIFYGLLQNTHAAAGTVSVAIDPYQVALAIARNQWDDWASEVGGVPRGYDVWVLDAAMMEDGSGTGDPILDGAGLRERKGSSKLDHNPALARYPL